MSRNSWALITICFLAAVANAPRAEAAAAEPNPVVAIRLENLSGLVVPDLVWAKELSAGIYQKAGITLRWIIDDHTTADRTLTVILTTSATAPSGLTSDATGVAPSPGDGTRGTTAYVFIDRVMSFAASRRVAPPYVLACAMAHEIGHLLLPPNAHTSDGIMRPSWHPQHFPPQRPGIPGFPPEQAQLLRRRLSRAKPS